MVDWAWNTSWLPTTGHSKVADGWLGQVWVLQLFLLFDQRMSSFQPVAGFPLLYMCWNRVCTSGLGTVLDSRNFKCVLTCDGVCYAGDRTFKSSYWLVSVLATLMIWTLGFSTEGEWVDHSDSLQNWSLQACQNLCVFTVLKIDSYVRECCKACSEWCI